MLTSFSNPNYGLDALNSNLLTPSSTSSSGGTSYDPETGSLVPSSVSLTSLDNTPSFGTSVVATSQALRGKEGEARGQGNLNESRGQKAGEEILAEGNSATLGIYLLTNSMGTHSKGNCFEGADCRATHSRGYLF